MTDGASMMVAARKRLAEVDTDTLKDMWSIDGRTDWAEQALRLELIERGESEQELDAIVMRRGEIAANIPPSARGTLWNYGFVGRILTLAGVTLWLILVRAGHGSGSLAVSGAVAILGIYVYVLTRRTLAQKRHPLTTATSFVMYWQLVGAWLLLVGAIIGAAFMCVGAFQAKGTSHPVGASVD